MSISISLVEEVVNERSRSRALRGILFAARSFSMGETSAAVGVSRIVASFLDASERGQVELSVDRGGHWRHLIDY